MNASSLVVSRILGAASARGLHALGAAGAASVLAFVACVSHDPALSTSSGSAHVSLTSSADPIEEIDLASPGDDVYLRLLDEGDRCELSISLSKPTGGDLSARDSTWILVQVDGDRLGDLYAGRSLDLVTSTSDAVGFGHVVQMQRKTAGGPVSVWESEGGHLHVDPLPPPGGRATARLSGVALTSASGDLTLDATVSARYVGVEQLDSAKPVGGCPKVAQ